MSLLIPIAFIIAAVTLQYLTVYLAYLPVSRKSVTQWQMHKTSLLVTGFSILAGILTGLIGTSSSVAIPITAVMVYQMGCSRATSRHGPPAGSSSASLSCWSSALSPSL